jgi:glycosyltransferase involved in cell wall biosynthesis
VASVKILVFTHLYPSGDRKDTTSSAIHNFVKFWEATEDIMVIKPVYLTKKAIGSWLHSRFPYRKYQIGSTPVYEFPVCNLTIAGTFSLLPILIFLADRRFKPDSVVSHLYPSHRWGAQLATMLRCKLIVGIHGTDVYKYNKYSARMGIIADLLVFRSESIRKAYYALYGTRSGRREYTAISGIDTSLIVRNCERKAGAVPNLATVASLIPLKRIDTIIEALALLKNKSWKYRVVGDGPERSHLEELAGEKGIGEKVFFTGQVPHNAVFSFLDEALAFIMVSAPETLGLAYLEAMARGCIVVGAKGWGIDGIVQNGINGFLCEPGDVPGIAKVISTILDSNAEERKQIVDSSINTVSYCDEASIAKKYLLAIKSTVNKVGQ